MASSYLSSLFDNAEWILDIVGMSRIDLYEPKQAYTLHLNRELSFAANSIRDVRTFLLHTAENNWDYGFIYCHNKKKLDKFPDVVVRTLTLKWVPVSYRVGDKDVMTIRNAEGPSWLRGETPVWHGFAPPDSQCPRIYLSPQPGEGPPGDHPHEGDPSHQEAGGRRSRGSRTGRRARGRRGGTSED